MRLSLLRRSHDGSQVCIVQVLLTPAVSTLHRLRHPNTSHRDDAIGVPLRQRRLIQKT